MLKEILTAVLMPNGFNKNPQDSPTVVELAKEIDRVIVLGGIMINVSDDTLINDVFLPLEFCGYQFVGRKDSAGKDVVDVNHEDFFKATFPQGH